MALRPTPARVASSGLFHRPLPRLWALVRGLVGPASFDRPPPAGTAGTCSLADYSASIDHLLRTSPIRSLLEGVRAFNHGGIDELARLCPMRGRRVLDIAASPYGFALERALWHGAAEYVGIGLGVEQPAAVRSARGVGRLCNMNAERLAFDDERFDLVLSLSAFEHIHDVPRALAEVRRVLRTGGSALISFEPIWTSSHGHHLHHFGPVAKRFPDWGHLLWTREEMRAKLAGVWPAGARLTLDEALHWVYDSDELNRIGVATHRQHFAGCGLLAEWVRPVVERRTDGDYVAHVAARTGLPAADLLTRGLTYFLHKGHVPLRRRARVWAKKCFGRHG